MSPGRQLLTESHVISSGARLIHFVIAFGCAVSGLSGLQAQEREPIPVRIKVEDRGELGWTREVRAQSRRDAIHS